MLISLKNHLRDLLPKKHQVPVKYWYSKLRGTLELEMKILGLIVRKNDRVIDIGGNRGVYAYQLCQLGAKVEVFEPNPACLEVLSAWAANKPNIAVHPVALSSQAGSANLHIPIDTAGVEHDASASLEHGDFALARDAFVTLQTLDSYQFENVSFIKIDVEGHECSVIEGAIATLASSKPALLIEIEQRHNSRPIAEIFKMILGNGFQGFFISNNALLPIKDFDVAYHQAPQNFGVAMSPYINNFIFLHTEKLDAGLYEQLLNRRF